MKIDILKHKKEFLITSFIIWGHGSRSKWGPTIRFSDIIWRPIYKSLSILTWLLNTIRIVHSRYFWIDIISNTSSNWWYWISFGIRLPSYVRIIFLRITFCSLLSCWYWDWFRFPIKAVYHISHRISIIIIITRQIIVCHSTNMAGACLFLNVRNHR